MRLRLLSHLRALHIRPHRRRTRLRLRHTEELEALQPPRRTHRHHPATRQRLRATHQRRRVTARRHLLTRLLRPITVLPRRRTVPRHPCTARRVRSLVVGATGDRQHRLLLQATARPLRFTARQVRLRTLTLLLLPSFRPTHRGRRRTLHLRRSTRRPRLLILLRKFISNKIPYVMALTSTQITSPVMRHILRYIS